MDGWMDGWIDGALLYQVNSDNLEVSSTLIPHYHGLDRLTTKKDGPATSVGALFLALRRIRWPPAYLNLVWVYLRLDPQLVKPLTQKVAGKRTNVWGETTFLMGTPWSL